MTPLSHHEILRLVAPFTRRGLRLDSAASDRQKRRLVFAAPAEASDAEGRAVRRTRFLLEPRDRDTWRLERVTDDPAGVSAMVAIEGADLEAMLARIESVPTERQFGTGEGYVLATSWRLPETGDARADPVLVEGVARLSDAVLTLRMPTLRGYPADIELAAPDGGHLDLTEDFLAVLGLAWSTLRHDGEKWVGSLRPRWREPSRSRAAEAALTTAAEHSACTFAAPPSHFHARLSRARWGVALRRAVPLLVCILLLAGTLSLSKLDIDQNSGLWVALFHAPPLLLVAFFCFREIPRIEFPPLPRASTSTTWRPAPVRDAAASSHGSRGRAPGHV